jgi:autotransporter translocation and assembly factor TamB
LPDIDLAVLGLVSRDILDPSGTLSGSVSLRGTLKRIWPEGSLAIRDGGIRIPKREEKLHSIQGTFSLDSTGVQIRSLQGRIGKDGRLQVTGWWRDLGHFNLEAKVQEATFFETGFYHVTADGDLNAFPVATATGSYPLIVGTVDVREGAIIGDLAKQPLPPAGALSRPSPWRAEIDVNAPGNLRMSTAIASVELGEGEDIHVSFQDPLINVSGRIQVLGGRYRVFNNIFTITSGIVEFRDTGRLPEPILDVYAETSVNDLTNSEVTPQQVLVKIHVTGPVLALNIEFSSEPVKSQTEIVELLSLGRLNDPTTGSFGARDPSRQYLFTEVVSQIESQLANRIAGLENIQLVPGSAPGEAWKVSVRRTLVPQVSVAYSRELAGTASQEVNVRYNLRGRLYLNADVERLMKQGTPTDRYSLDLRMRFEY